MQKIKRFLEHWPVLDRIVRRIYLPIAYRYVSFIGYLNRNRQGDLLYVKHPPSEHGWTESWNSKESGHRPFLVEKIASFSQISSVLEIGCGVGPNLYSLGKRYPQAEIRGIDINALAVQLGNSLLAQDGISNVELSVGRVEQLGEIEDKRFDVVFTDALLILIGRDKINEVARNMVRIARKGLILLEWHDFDQRLNDRQGLGVFTGHWVRDYVALLTQFVPAEQIQVTRFNFAGDSRARCGGWGKYGAIVKVTL